MSHSIRKIRIAATGAAVVAAGFLGASVGASAGDGDESRSQVLMRQYLAQPFERGSTAGSGYDLSFSNGSNHVASPKNDGVSRSQELMLQRLRNGANY